MDEKDGSQVSGELIAVKKASLLLLVGGPVAGTDVAVSLNEIQKVKIVKKSRLVRGLGYGLLIGGGVGALTGLAGGDDPGAWFLSTTSEKAAFYGAMGGALGIILGGIVGGFSGIDESISFERKSEAELRSIQIKLAGFARINDKIY